jgi:hypothetical protein
VTASVWMFTHLSDRCRRWWSAMLILIMSCTSELALREGVLERSFRYEALFILRLLKMAKKIPITIVGIPNRIAIRGSQPT